MQFITVPIYALDTLRNLIPLMDTVSKTTEVNVILVLQGIHDSESSLSKVYSKSETRVTGVKVSIVLHTRFVQRIVLHNPNKPQKYNCVAPSETIKLNNYIVSR